MTTPSSRRAASRPLSAGQVFRRTPPEDEPDAWALYRGVSEYRSGIDWLATGVSRARLFITEVQDDGTPGDVPILDDAPQADLLQLPLQELFGTGETQAEMLYRWAVHLEVTGSTFIAGYDNPHTGQRVWQSAAQPEIRFDLAGGAAEIKLPDGTDTWVRLDLGTDGASSLIRMWRRDPAEAWLAATNLVSLRPILELILALTAAQTATANSRCAGAGLVGIPDSLQVQTGPAPGGGGSIQAGGVGSRDFAGALTEAMLAPLENPGSASAVVPIVFTGPGDDIDKIKHFDWATAFAEQIPALIEQAITRLAIGMAIPPEVLKGFSDVNHWNSFTIMDGAIQYSIAPRTELIAGALTTAFVRPMLAKLGIDDPMRYAVGYDLSQVTHKPDQSANGTIAWDKLLISDDAERRALGFDDDDKPSDKERQRRLEEQLARTSSDIAAALLGIQIDTEQVTTPTAPDAPPGQEQPTTGDQDEPAAAVDDAQRPSEERPADITRPALPASSRTEADLAADVTAAALAEANAWRMASMEQAALRALARCGHNLINRYGRGARPEVDGVDVREVHTVLKAYEEWADDMLSGAHYELRASTQGLDTDAVEIVDAYVRLLLTKMTPHDPRLLAEVADAVAVHKEFNDA